MPALKPPGTVSTKQSLQNQSAPSPTTTPANAPAQKPAAASMPESWIGVIDLGSSALKCMASPANEPDELHLVAQLPTPTLEAGHQSEFIVGQLDACVTQAYEALASFMADDKAHKNSNCRVLTVIALTGQIGGVLLLDEQKRLMPPSLTWADRRATAEAQAFWQTYDDRFKALLGHDLPAQTCWSAPKIRRLMKLAGETIYSAPEDTPGNAPKHAPADTPQGRVSCVLQLPDYAFFRLTGHLKSSPTVGISLVDQAKGQYQQAMLAWAGLRAEQLPALCGAVAICPLADSLAKRWQAITKQDNLASESNQIKPPVILLAGADMYCGLYGAMASQGQAIIQAGTTEIAGVVVGKNHQPPCPKVLLRLACPDTSVASSDERSMDFIYGSTSNGGMSLTWLAREHGLDVCDPALWARASKLTPQPDGLIFVPHVNGARAPLWCDQAMGGFVGATACCDPPHLLVAVLQGCAMSKRSVLQAAGVRVMTTEHGDHADREDAPSQEPPQIIVAGGGAKQALANQIRADVFGRPVVARHVSDVTAAGAIAIALNHISTTRSPDVNHHASHHVSQGERWLEQLHHRAGSSHYQPNVAHRATYEILYKRYLEAEQTMLPQTQSSM